MRLLLLKGDMRLQFRYGFSLLYLLFTLLYLGVLFALPEAWREKAALLMIFTDPSAMGLYFMGSMVLFEKSERVLDSIAVSPVTARDYVLSKLLSIGLLSVAVGLVLGLSAGVVRYPLAFLTGLFLCSCLFSSIGLITACKIATLNQFVLATVPSEILINVPAIAWLFGYRPGWLLLHPGACMMALCSGEGPLFPAFACLLLWTTLFAVLAQRTVRKMLRSVGGVKL